MRNKRNLKQVFQYHLGSNSGEDYFCEVKKGSFEKVEPVFIGGDTYLYVPKDEESHNNKILEKLEDLAKKGSEGITLEQKQMINAYEISSTGDEHEPIISLVRFCRI